LADPAVPLFVYVLTLIFEYADCAENGQYFSLYREEADGKLGLLGYNAV
jgi:hypothetical protein